MSDSAPDLATGTGPLHALRQAGTITGLCLAKNHEIIENLFSFPDQRVSDLIAIVDDVMAYFEQENRAVDQMAFGYDGGNLVVVTDESYRLIVMHELVDEIDFIAKAARAFLIDYQMDLYAQEMRPVTARQVVRATAAETPDEEIEVHTGPIQPQVSATPADEPVAPPTPLPTAETPPEPPAPNAEPPEPIAEPQVMVATPESTSDRSAITSSGAVSFDEAQARNSVLAPDQPENTLPPPRKARSRS